MSDAATRAAKTSVCARCGAPFGCGVNTGACWCAAVPSTPAQLLRIKETYKGCLCPTCLTAELGSLER